MSVESSAVPLPQARPFGEQVTAFIAVSFELARRAWLKAILCQVVFAVIAGAIFALGVLTLFVFGNSRWANPILAVIGTILTVVVAALGPPALFAGPLAAFGTAVRPPRVSLREVLACATLRMAPVLLALMLTAMAVTTLAGVCFGIWEIARGRFGLHEHAWMILPMLGLPCLMALFAGRFVFATLFVALGRVGVLGTGFVDGIEHYERVGTRGHGWLGAGALLASIVPIVATSAGAYPGLEISESFRTLAIALGVEASVLCVALFSVAAFVVAEGEDARLLEPHDRPEVAA